MSAHSPCSHLPLSGATRALVAPFVGAVLALGILAGSSFAMPFFKAENSHFPPERLAEIERMMAGE